MFDDEEEYGEGFLNEDLERFEAFLKGAELGFLDADRFEVLIDHLLINGRYRDALACVDEALYQYSYNQLFKLRKAQSLSAIGELKDSINLLTELERTGLASFEVLLTKASVFSQLKDSTNAIKYFKASIEKSEPEDRDEVYLDLAMEYENINDFKSALAVLKEAIENNPNNEAAIYEVAFCYDQMGEYDKAIQCYSDFIDENPYSFTSWYNLGNAYLKQENFDKAIWAYDYCMLINEDFGPVHFNAGNAFLASNRYTKAIEHFKKCMELDGDDPMALCYIGECMEQLNDLEQAKEYYKKSLELAPMLADAWLGLGIIEDLEGRTREGITLIRKAADLDPENAGVYHVLAGAHENIEEYDEAEEFYQLALALDPTDEACLIDYVNLLSESSHFEAFQYLEDIENIEPRNRAIDLLKVNLLVKLGKKEEAVELFKICTEEDKAYAKELFEINPDLKSIPELVLLADN